MSSAEINQSQYKMYSTCLYGSTATATYICSYAPQLHASFAYFKPMLNIDRQTPSMPVIHNDRRRTKSRLRWFWHIRNQTISNLRYVSTIERTGNISTHKTTSLWHHKCRGNLNMINRSRPKSNYALKKRLINNTCVRTAVTCKEFYCINSSCCNITTVNFSDLICIDRGFVGMW